MTEVVHVRWAGPSTPDRPQTSLDRTWLDRTWLDRTWLDRTERRRMARLRHPADRARFLVARVLLKQLVGELSDVDPVSVRLSYDCQQCGEPHGKPGVATPFATPGWQVSIAHAGRRVAVAATRVGAVGVDVEPVDGVRFEGFDAVALSDRESAALAHLPPAARNQARATAWVRKEAVLKATGLGLARDPATVDLADLGPARTVLDLAVGDGYAAAVAVLTDGPVRLEVAEVSERARSRPAGPGAPARPASRAAARRGRRTGRRAPGTAPW